MDRGAQISVFRDWIREKHFGQAEAVQAVLEILELYLAGLRSIEKPAGVFLFLGPTGTGKTYLARLVAEFWGGSRDALLTVDCGEFTHGHEVAKLTGSPPGYLGHRETKALLRRENLASRIRKKDCPFTFLLFDEVDKAGHELQSLLLGILDNGRMSTGDNETVLFHDTLIFLTANTGSREMANLGKWGFSQTMTRTKESLSSVALRASRKKFLPELLNRVDRIIVFHELDAQVMARIVRAELARIKDLLVLKGISLSWSEPVLDFLASKADPVYGARDISRIVEREVALPLASRINSSGVKAGAKIHIHLDNQNKTLDFLLAQEAVVS